MKNFKYTLDASSMVNAIFICLMMSIFCGCLVLVSSYQDLLNQKLGLQEALLHRNNSAFHYAMSNLSELPINQETDIDVYDDGIVSIATRKPWGFQEVLTVRTVFKGDTLTKTSFVGVQPKKNELALYLTDYDKPFKTSGNTKITGNISIPGGKMEQAYINGTTGNSVAITGKTTKSNNKLPRLHANPEINLNHETTLLDNLDAQSILVNDFANDTKLIQMENLKTNQDFALKGNFILVSKRPIEISSKSRLHDVMIVAPEVTFKSGFKGNVHTVAQRTVTIEDNVSLAYPSSIYIKSDRDSIAVTMAKNSSLLGGIIITGDTYQGALKRQINIDEDAIVVGHVYCYGKTELKGEIRGSLYTDKLFLKTESSAYENLMLNGTIDRTSLPEGFIGLPLFHDNSEHPDYAIIKEL